MPQLRAKNFREKADVQQGQFETLPLEALVADPANPRIHSQDQIAAIASSITAFGFNAPILIDKANRVVAGHGRLEAARLLQLAAVPVVRLAHLTRSQARAYTLADNKLTDRSRWDDVKVAEALRDLSEIALEFDFEAIGFEQAEVDLRIQSLQPDEEVDVGEEIGTPAGPSVTQLGDLWSLGPHRVSCGDALEMSPYQLLFGQERATAQFSDPPFNVKVRGHVSGRGRRNHREFPMASGEMDPDAFQAFLKRALVASTFFLTDEATSFICMDWRHMAELQGAIAEADQQLINLCVWVKTNGGMGSLYRSQHELIFVISKPGAKRRNNVQLGKFGRYRTNVWNYPGMNGFARRGQVKGVDLHPTVKPVAMVADAICDVTKRGDIVLDAFCGSGTTIIAAHRTGRRGFGIELDPAYVDVAIARWQKLTGERATHSSGKTFDEIAAERGGADVAS